LSGVHLLLPRTDAGAFTEAGIVLVVGIFLFTLAAHRRAWNAAWLIGGLTTASIGFFALRTLH
jgi:hypothetical protein